MSNQSLVKHYTRLHFAISVCMAIAITLVLVLLLSSDSKPVIPAVSELIAVIIVGLVYASPFFRHRLQRAPMSHLTESDKDLLKLSITGITLVALSPFVLPQGTMEVGSATNKALSIVAIAALSIVPISIGIHFLLVLIARYVLPFDPRRPQ